MEPRIKFQKSLSALSDIDVVTLRLASKKIVSKSANVDPAKSALDVFKSFVNVGLFPSRNPSAWAATEGYEHNAEAIDARFANQIEASPDFRVNLIDLDNNSHVMEVIFNVNLLVVNCKGLSNEQVKEIQCATASTPYGQVEIHA